jgi:hypothetical protein
MAFIDRIKMKSPQSGFFYEFKKHRTKMLKPKDSPIKEPYYKEFFR